MIKIVSQLSEEDRKIIKEILYSITDIWGDFYITLDNYRLPIRENSDILYSLLDEGDKVIFDEGGNGLVIITGFAENRDRKYLKLLVNNLDIADQLLINLDQNCSSNIYCKIKKLNPLKQILLQNNFEFKGGRGAEVLLYKEGVTYSSTNKEA